MKRIVLILLLSFAYVAQAQYLAPMNAKNSGSWSVGLLRIDSSFNLRLFDTAVTKLAFPSNLNNRWARQGQRLYVYNGSFFELADNVPAIDTSSLSARINARVKYTDTAAMLVGYVRAARLNDTALAIRSAIPNVSGKVNYSDTAAMLSPYLRKADTTAMLSKYLRKADTTAMLLPYARKTLVNDTAAAIRAAIPNVSGKVNYSDTAAMLAPYYRTATATTALALKQNLTDTTTWDATKKNLADTALALRALIPSGTDTTSLSNRIDARVKYTDTASMLSPYLRSADAATTYVPYTGATTNVNLGEFQASVGQVTLDQTPTQTAGVGVLRWNDSDGTADLGLKGGNVTLQVGQEEVVRVVNKTGANLLESQYHAVYVSGAQGQRLKVGNAIALADSSSAATIGLVTENIDLNQEGFITTNGLVRNINTTGSLQGETWNDGDLLYLSGTTAGQITNVKPIAPTHTVIIGYVVHAHINQGKIFVKVDNGYELDELHNVRIVSAANNEGLFYDSAAKLWENKSISTVLGYTPANNATVVKYADTASMLTSYLRKVDTASLSTRIDTKLNSADTASLSNRINTKLNSADTASLSTRIDARVKYTDTASMLSPYYRTATATAALATKVNYTDTAAMLGGYLRKVDTSTLSNRINLKLNSSDTASLSTRIEARVKYTDTATMLSPYYRTATATADLATKVNYTDTSTMLTPYLRKGDTATMLGGYLRKVDTASLSNRINAAGNDWKLTGNAGTNASTNYIGTSDNVDVVLRRNNVEKLRIANASISTADPLRIGTNSFNAPASFALAANNWVFGSDAVAMGQNQFRSTGNIGWSYISGGAGIGSFTISNTGFRTYQGNGGYIWYESGVERMRIINGNGNFLLNGSQSNFPFIYRGTTVANLFNISPSTNNVGIGTNAPNASSILDLTSTTQGLLLPRMTTTQINAIATPAAGLTVYNTTLALICFYNGTAWQRVTATAM